MNPQNRVRVYRYDNNNHCQNPDGSCSRNVVHAPPNYDGEYTSNDYNARYNDAYNRDNYRHYQYASGNTNNQYTRRNDAVNYYGYNSHHAPGYNSGYHNYNNRYPNYNYANAPTHSGYYPSYHSDPYNFHSAPPNGAQNGNTTDPNNRYDSQSSNKYVSESDYVNVAGHNPGESRDLRRRN